MKKIVLFLLVFTVWSCGLLKTTSRHREKRKIHSVETGKRIIKLPGDSVVYIPTVKYKDTTIVKENRNVVLKTTFRQNDIKKINCEQKPQDIEETYTKQTDEKIKTTDSKSEGLQFKPVYVIYLFLLLGGLITINNLTKKTK